MLKAPPQDTQQRRKVPNFSVLPVRGAVPPQHSSQAGLGVQDSPKLQCPCQGSPAIPPWAPEEPDQEIQTLLQAPKAAGGRAVL